MFFLTPLLKALKCSMMKPALPDRIIPYLIDLRKVVILSFIFILAYVLSYYIAATFNGVDASSYFYLLQNIFPLFAFSGCSIGSKINKKDCKSFENQDYIEELGGKGPPIAVYLRVSSARQAKQGMSIEAQREAANKMKCELNPLRIYWFIDAGKSAKSAKDFDKLKINTILKLKEEKKISELWAFDISRIGRECRKLLYFFLEFCDDGIIRTPEKQYNLNDLASMITFIIEAHSAEKANRDRTAAAMASKAQFFKKYKWNKPLPFGYHKSPVKADNSQKASLWLAKDTDKCIVIKDIFSLFLQEKNIEEVTRRVNQKYLSVIPPLSKYQIKRILTDPVVIGKPRHLGEIVEDASLVIIDEDTFMKCATIFDALRRKCKPKWTKVIGKMATEQPISLLTLLLEKVNLQCKICGGKINWNGPDKRMEQEKLLCMKCGKELRFLTKSQLQSPRHETFSSLSAIDKTDPIETKRKLNKKSIRTELKKVHRMKELTFFFK